MKRQKSTLTVLTALTIIIATCGGGGAFEDLGTAAVKARRSSPMNGAALNGIGWNGLQKNGLYNNGLYSNGLQHNGLKANSVRLNAPHSQGTSLNASSADQATPSAAQGAFVTEGVSVVNGRLVLN